MSEEKTDPLVEIRERMMYELFKANQIAEKAKMPEGTAVRVNCHYSKIDPTLLRRVFLRVTMGEEREDEIEVAVLQMKRRYHHRYEDVAAGDPLNSPDTKFRVLKSDDISNLAARAVSAASAAIARRERNKAKEEFFDLVEKIAGARPSYIHDCVMVKVNGETRLSVKIDGIDNVGLMGLTLEELKAAMEAVQAMSAPAPTE